MAIKPTINKPEWASSEAVGGGNVTEPVSRKTTGYQKTGVPAIPEKPTYEELNFLFKTMSDWTDYFDKRIDEVSTFYVEGSGSAADVYELEGEISGQQILSYRDGMRIRFRVTNTNTGSSTVDIDSIGAKSLLLNGQALIGNELLAGEIVEMVYVQSADNFEIVNAVKTINGFPSFRYSSSPTIDVFNMSSRSSKSVRINTSIAASTSNQNVITINSSGGVGPQVFFKSNIKASNTTGPIDFATWDMQGMYLYYTGFNGSGDFAFDVVNRALHVGDLNFHTDISFNFNTISDTSVEIRVSNSGTGIASLFFEFEISIL